MDIVTFGYKEIITYGIQLMWRRLRRMVTFVWANKFYLYYKNRFQNIFLCSNTLPKKKICIFALYQPSGIPNYIFEYLTQIQKNQFSIFVVSTAPLLKQDLSVLKTLCFRIIERPNQGQDFGSYKIGVRETLKNYKCSQLLLANDSMVGPFYKLTPIFKKMNAGHFDAWGMSDAFYTSYHLGSFFLVLSKNILEEIQFQKFWKDYKPYNSSKHAVKKGEITLNKIILRISKNIGVAFPLEEMVWKLKKQNKDLQSFLAENKCQDLKSTDAFQRNPHDPISVNILKACFQKSPLYLFWPFYLKQGYPFIKKKVFNKLPAQKRSVLLKNLPPFKGK